MDYFRTSNDPPYHALARTAAEKDEVLEISSKSNSPLGRSLSAMNLRIPGHKMRPLENVYQAAKDYGSGPDPTIEELANGFKAKQAARERHARETAAGNRLTGFTVDGHHWPAASGTACYDHLWAQGAVGRYGQNLQALLKDYRGYSDMYFQPSRGLACQAAAAASTVVLLQAHQKSGRAGEPPELNDPQAYADWRRVDIETRTLQQGTPPQARATTVANIRRHERTADDVYIGRPSQWGNPFPLKDESQRATVIEKYRDQLAQAVDSGQMQTNKLAALAGKTLLCYCAPKACHGNVLARAATWAAAGADPAKADWKTDPIERDGHYAAKATTMGPPAETVRPDVRNKPARGRQPAFGREDLATLMNTRAR